MAFLLAGLYNDGRGAGRRIWSYSFTDAQSVVEASGYFDDQSDNLQVDDLLKCFDETLNIDYQLEVDAITSAGVVTTRRTAIITSGVISGLGATRTLTPAESGQTILFDRAAGIVVTLPTATVGLKYRFVVTVSVTSNAMSVVTGASDFMVGGLQGYIDTTAVTEGHFADGATHLGISSNGTTTGGLIGTVFEVEAITAVVWLVTGLLGSSGTLATPFTT